MKSKYISIDFVGKHKQIQHIMNLVQEKKFFPLEDVTYVSTTTPAVPGDPGTPAIPPHYSVPASSDLRLYYIPVTNILTSCILYWRTELDSTNMADEVGELSIYINNMITNFGYTGMTFTFKAIDISQYPEQFDIRRNATNSIVHEELHLMPLVRS